MATGDVTISVAVEGGETKSATFTAATKEKAKLYVTTDDNDLSADADWQVFEVNKLANVILAQANAQIQSEAKWTPKSFTAAS